MGEEAGTGSNVFNRTSSTCLPMTVTPLVLGPLWSKRVFRPFQTFPTYSVSHVVNVLPTGITEDQSFKASSVSSDHFFPVWFTAGCLRTSSLYTGWRRTRLRLILPSGGRGCDDIVSERCQILSTALKQDPPVCTAKWKFSDNSSTY